MTLLLIESMLIVLPKPDYICLVIFSKFRRGLIPTISRTEYADLYMAITETEKRVSNASNGVKCISSLL